MNVIIKLVKFSKMSNIPHTCLGGGGNNQGSYMSNQMVLHRLDACYRNCEKISHDNIVELISLLAIFFLLSHSIKHNIFLLKNTNFPIFFPNNV